MNHLNNETDISNLLSENRKLQQTIIEYRQSIKTIQKQIKKNELCVWDTCDHKWVRDRYCTFDEPCKYYCEKCSLYKDRRLYMN